MNPHLQRAYLLIQQSRFELAEQELRQALITEPSSGEAHALLAICYLERERFGEATQEAQTAIHLAPEDPVPQYALSHVLLRRQRLVEAEQAIREAIRLNPDSADYFGHLSQILIARQQWQAALEAAEQGLAIDPEDANCLNWRALALVRLGRTTEAGATIETALSREPENAFSHANMGWTYLEHNDAKQAMASFREALRLDPDNEWARNGLVRALNARNFVYRILLRYLLWMAKLSPQARWGVVIGGIIANRILRSLARNYPAIAPWITPILILYIAFVLLTWLGEPLFNLLLRLHPIGRHALSSEQKKGANLLGIVFVAGVIALVVGVVLLQFGVVIASVVCGFMLLPTSAIYRCSAGWPRTTMVIISGVLLLVGGASSALFVAAPLVADKSMHEYAQTLFGTFVIGVVLSTLAANILISSVVRR